MGSTKINCHLEVLLLGSHLTSFVLFLFLIIKVFIGILGQSFEIKFFAVFFITTYLFKTWFYQI
jgi:hypothetical protein